MDSSKTGKKRQGKNHSESVEVQPSRLKVPMTRLAVSENKQTLIRETIERITGKKFEFKDPSEYSDSGQNLGKSFWMQDRQLRVYGVVRPTKTRAEESSQETLMKQIATEALQQYGFDPSYCGKALDESDCDFGRAVKFLSDECFGSPASFRNIPVGIDSRSASYELRCEEVETLQAIYGDDVFRCVERDAHWRVRISPSHLIKYTGQGSYLNLDIRIPEGSLYPFEPPTINVSVVNGDPSMKLPTYVFLNLTLRLVQEARQNSLEQIPSVFSLISLLETEEVIAKSVTDPPMKHSLPMPSARETKKTSGNADWDGMSMSGVTQQNGRNNRSLGELIKENQLLKTRFRRKSISSVYMRMKQHRQNLPAWGYQENILSSIADNQVVIIQGMTGCGKSTQIPQFLLDEFLLSSNISHRSIICTQPRRISAIAVAERIAKERDEEVGNIVGYNIRLESAESKSTRLLFCTTGILLRRLESDSSMDHVTHIIIDEVHERSEESDFLLLICRDLLTKRPDLRILLMSATIESSLFSDYFGAAPVVQIPGRTFPVQKLFLEDVLGKVNYSLDSCSPYYKRTTKTSGPDPYGFEDDYVDDRRFPSDHIPDENLSPSQLEDRYGDLRSEVVSILSCMDHTKINYDLIETLVIWILTGHHEYPREGSILIFLPGIGEISTLFEKLEKATVLNGLSGKCVILPLHSSLTSEEQNKIFGNPGAGVRKIIIGTNLAETSITIDDCVFVIDAGRMKLSRYDPNKHMTSLDSEWVSVANALQRSGRAGRVQPGISFHMYTSHRFQHQLGKKPPPEIALVSLERSIMRCKSLPVFAGQTPVTILGKLLEPPTPQRIEGSLIRLQQLGALDANQNLTPLGCHLARLPVDIRVGKLMLFGAMFRCVDSALTIAACLSSKSPFVSPFKKREEAHAKKMKWCIGHSDHLTLLKVFKAWRDARKLSPKAARVFSSENFLSENTLDTICGLKQQYVELLSSIGFLQPGLSQAVFRRFRSSSDGILEVTGPKMNENSENYPLLLSVLCASFYPHLVRVLRPDQRYSKVGTGTVLSMPKPHQLKFLTENNESVRIHPSSVLHSCGNYDSPYVIFHQKMKTSNTFILDCSMVPAFPLVLCGGSDIHVKLHQGSFVIEVDDGWIKFVCDSHKVAELLVILREQLDTLLLDKIRDPSLDLCDDHLSNALLSTVTTIITNPTTD